VSYAEFLRLIGMVRSVHISDRGAIGASASTRSFRPAISVALAWLTIHELFPYFELQGTSYGVGDRLWQECP